MSTKEELVNTIQSYLKIENEMKVLQKELKERRLLRKNLSDKLINIMKNNEIDCFDLSEGKILYTQNKVKTPLTKKHIIECIHKYFDKIPSIDSNEVTNFILENRQEQIKENIKHKPNKNI